MIGWSATFCCGLPVFVIALPRRFRLPFPWPHSHPHLATKPQPISLSSSSTYHPSIPPLHHHESEWCQVVVGTTYIGRPVSEYPCDEVIREQSRMMNQSSNRGLVVSLLWFRFGLLTAGPAFSFASVFFPFLPFGPNLGRLHRSWVSIHNSIVIGTQCCLV